jgi:hypothetical protein
LLAATRSASEGTSMALGGDTGEDGVRLSGGAWWDGAVEGWWSVVAPSGTTMALGVVGGEKGEDGVRLSGGGNGGMVRWWGGGVCWHRRPARSCLWGVEWSGGTVRWWSVVAPSGTTGHPGVHRDTPEYPGTPRSSPGQPGVSREYPGTPRSTPGHPGAPRDTPEFPGTPHAGGSSAAGSSLPRSHRANRFAAVSADAGWRRKHVRLSDVQAFPPDVSGSSLTLPTPTLHLTYNLDFCSLLTLTPPQPYT